MQFLTGRFATIATPPGTGSTSQFGVKLWFAMSMRGSSAAGAWGPATLNALLETTASAQPVQRKDTSSMQQATNGRQQSAQTPQRAILATQAHSSRMCLRGAAVQHGPATLNALLEIPVVETTASAQPVRRRQQTTAGGRRQSAGSASTLANVQPCAAQVHDSRVCL